MGSDKIPAILIDPESGNYRTAKITPDVFYSRFWVASVWLCVDIESISVLLAAAGFGFFKGRANPGFHFVKQGSAESIMEECIVEMADVTPKAIVTVTAF